MNVDATLKVSMGLVLLSLGIVIYIMMKSR